MKLQLNRVWIKRHESLALNFALTGNGVGIFCFSDSVRQILDKRYVIIKGCCRVPCGAAEVAAPKP